MFWAVILENVESSLPQGPSNSIVYTFGAQKSLQSTCDVGPFGSKPFLFQLFLNAQAPAFLTELQAIFGFRDLGSLLSSCSGQHSPHKMPQHHVLVPPMPEPSCRGSERTDEECPFIVHMNIILPIVSIVVPLFGVAKSILRILKGDPKKELQWRL